MNNLILYTTDDGKSQIQLRAEEDTVWLSQLDMAELFNATKQNISLHLKNIFKDGELVEHSVVKESLTAAADGKGYQTKLYNLDAILAVGYRVRSPRGGARYKSGLQPSKFPFDPEPRALPWADMEWGLWPMGHPFSRANLGTSRQRQTPVPRHQR